MIGKCLTYRDGKAQSYKKIFPGRDGYLRMKRHLETGRRSRVMSLYFQIQFIKERNKNADSKQGTQGPSFSFSVREQREKEWTLSLYNAVNGASYTEPDDILFTAIDDAVYMGMKNELSFILFHVMNIYEQQSTYNPNMPVPRCRQSTMPPHRLLLRLALTQISGIDIHRYFCNAVH